MYDIAIIGSGPAGISAAMNAKILNQNFIWFASLSVSKKVGQAALVKNYLGLPDVSGEELSKAFLNHAKSLGIKPVDKVVNGVYSGGNCFTLLSGTEDFTAKTVILCLGVDTAKIEGEERLVGRGISYCATCDGFMYRGKNIAILCTDKRFEHEIEFLCSVANKAYVMPLYKGYEIKSQNAEILLKSPIRFEGEKRLEKIVFKDGSLEIDGLFILRSSVSPSILLHGLEMDEGHIVVDRAMQTNIKGVFAAGDCTGRPYQYMKAAGEGNVALHSAVQYLSEIEQ
ncbi:MAG: NAD(P)/FAD-dependent oxidoreductase [Clostridiales bacterium]|nr:NAD(P)/FAD-dependent oxidoreductase [Clostridiales bacterium]